MSLLPIITLPDPALRLVSTPVETFDAALEKLAADMLDTMYDAPGIGLAAIQVNVPKRLLVLDVADTDDDEEPSDAQGDDTPKPKAKASKKPMVLVNPRILRLGDEMGVYEEGCLSLPDVRLDIERPTTLKVAFQGLDGKPHELDADGLTATVIQHEIDHLDGRLIIDFLTRLKRDMIIRRFKKQARVAT